uniref:Putative secreted protein n=1 Tax=Panstrongylus lignarius TaxID=156445 RepID=A0A224XNP0_9HEMI
MLYLTIYLTGMFICNGLAFEENLTVDTKNEQNFTAEQRLLQDLIYLSSNADYSSKTDERFVYFNPLNFNKFMEHQYEEKEYKSRLIQNSQSRHCIALKNNFEMLTSHVKVILQHCYERAQFQLKSLLDKATGLRKAIMNEIAKLATNNTRQEQYSTVPLPIQLHVARESARNMSSNAITTRIEFFNKMIERFEMAKKTDRNRNKFQCKIVWRCGKYLRRRD